MTGIPARAADLSDYPLHRFEALGELSPADVTDIRQLGEPPIMFPRGDLIWTEGQATEGFFLLLEGWVSSSVSLPNGGRLVQKLHLAGDMLGTPSLVLPVAADTLTALTNVSASFVSELSLRKLFATNPKLTGLFFMAAQMERIALIDALAIAGRSSAIENMAHLLLDLHFRLGKLGLVSENSFNVPITQEIIGDMLGITSVHVNRVLQEMRRRDLIEAQGRRITLLDLPALRKLSPLPRRAPRINPAWLPGADGADS